MALIQVLFIEVKAQFMGTLVDAANKGVTGSLLNEKRSKLSSCLVVLVVERAPSVQILLNTLGLHISVLVIFFEQKLNRDPKMDCHRTVIQNMIKEGKIVPSEVTVKLLQRAMQESDNDKFFIDGFPRNEENRAALEKVTGIVPEFVLYFYCPEEEIERRLLGRNQGRDDDNIETIKKRFNVFLESSLPVIEYYSSKGKVQKIDA